MSRPEAVLIVDDDDMYVRALTRQLRELGFPFVYRATSAQQALAMLDRVHPSLVLTELSRGHQASGGDVITRARELGASVAIISGRAQVGGVEFGVPLQCKSELSGDALEKLVLKLISEAQQRSRNSVRVAEQVA